MTDPGARATTKDLVVTRTYDAPLEDVWRFWVEPRKVKQWWGPEGFSCPVAKMDVRVGGTSFVAMSSPEYGTHYRNWHYEEVVPHERIVYIRKATDQAGNEVDPTTVGMPADFPETQRHIVTFRRVANDRTEVVFTEKEWPIIPLVEMSRVGLEECLDKVAAALSGEPRGA